MPVCIGMVSQAGRNANHNATTAAALNAGTSQRLRPESKVAS
jgi:hypothetical protein